MGIINLSASSELASVYTPGGSGDLRELVFYTMER